MKPCPYGGGVAVSTCKLSEGHPGHHVRRRCQQCGGHRIGGKWPPAPTWDPARCVDCGALYEGEPSERTETDPEKNRPLSPSMLEAGRSLARVTMRFLETVGVSWTDDLAEQAFSAVDGWSAAVAATVEHERQLLTELHERQLPYLTVEASGLEYVEATIRDLGGGRGFGAAAPPERKNAGRMTVAQIAEGFAHPAETLGAIEFALKLHAEGRLVHEPEAEVTDAEREYVEQRTTTPASERLRCNERFGTTALWCERELGHPFLHRSGGCTWMRSAANPPSKPAAQVPENTPLAHPPADPPQTDPIPAGATPTICGECEHLNAHHVQVSGGGRLCWCGCSYARFAGEHGPFPADPEHCSSCKSGIPRFIGRDATGAIIDIVHAIEPEKFSTGGLMWQQQCTISPGRAVALDLAFSEAGAEIGREIGRTAVAAAEAAEQAPAAPETWGICEIDRKPHVLWRDHKCVGWVS